MSGVEHAAKQIARGQPADYDGYVKARMRHEARDEAKKTHKLSRGPVSPEELDDARQAAEKVMADSPIDRRVARGY